MTPVTNRQIDNLTRQAAARVDFLTRRERKQYARVLKEALLWGRNTR
ncbi:MAG: hypothetical protein J1E02_08330 [Coprobacter sp.]|nr:hypothetical protein [Coprobacter sp.]